MDNQIKSSRRDQVHKTGVRISLLSKHYSYLTSMLLLHQLDKYILFLSSLFKLI